SQRADWPGNCCLTCRTKRPPAPERTPVPSKRTTAMPNSVNTNVGALVALQNLNATNADLQTTQGRINTGKRINNAKDNGALSATASIGTTVLATAMISTVNTAIASVSTALSKLGTGSKSLGSHQNFVNKLQDSIDIGIGNLVDADLAKESAKLQALQTKQQLGIQALSIANQSPQVLLALFR